MARRAARGEERRTTTITIRLTEAERIAVEQRAAASGLTTSAYAARALMGARIAVQQRRDLSPAAMSALARVGNNLNQIATAMHAGRIPLALDLDEAAAELRAFVRSQMNPADEPSPPQPLRSAWHGPAPQ